MGKEPSTTPLQLRAAIALSACKREPFRENDRAPAT